MAGDIGIQESIVTPTASGLEAAAGPVLHEYGPKVRVRIGGPPAGTPAGAALAPTTLSATEEVGLAALRMRQSDEYLARKESRPYAARAWSRGPELPLHPQEQPIVPIDSGAGSETDTLPAEAPLARRLAGRIAVGTIMVSGPGSLALSNAQQIKIAAEVQNGLSWLGAQSPAKDVTWVHDSHHVTVNAANAPGTPGGNQWEHFEKPWRDAALAKLNFGPGRAGVNSYISALKASKNASAAYCAFFTLYTLNHFAYCTGPYLVMHLENDGWGPDNLDRVFAHESGHVFGAPDEYQESGCSCGGSHGFFGKPNLNCESCAPGGGVECIMKANSWSMCSVTPYHLGFNGLPAAAPVAPAPHVA